MKIPKDLKRKIICDSIRANRLQSDGEGGFRPTLANNISEENAARILERWRD